MDRLGANGVAPLSRLPLEYRPDLLAWLNKLDDSIALHCDNSPGLV